MKRIALTLFVSGLTLTACGSSSQLEYDFVENSCDTGKHSFDSQALYCAGLKDSALNNNTTFSEGCALGARVDRYHQDCGSDWNGAGSASAAIAGGTRLDQSGDALTGGPTLAPTAITDPATVAQTQFELTCRVAAGDPLAGSTIEAKTRNLSVVILGSPLSGSAAILAADSVHCGVDAAPDESADVITETSTLTAAASTADITGRWWSTGVNSDAEATEHASLSLHADLSTGSGRLVCHAPRKDLSIPLSGCAVR